MLIKGATGKGRYKYPNPQRDSHIFQQINSNFDEADSVQFCRRNLTKCSNYGLIPSVLLHILIWDVCPWRFFHHLQITMMTSSNGNIFRVTGPLCGEFTGPGEFPTQRPVTQSFDVFFDLRLNKRLSKQPWGWWFETPSCSLWRHCNA